MKTKMITLLGLIAFGVTAAHGSDPDQPKMNGKLIVRILAPEVACYTGKPYNKTLGQYLFSYRNYDPQLARWTTPDPSGFPDGANNRCYTNSPAYNFDPNGLLIEGAYSITKRTLTLRDPELRLIYTFGDMHSGNDNFDDINKSNVGPLPTGEYNIYTWNKWDPTFFENRTAFILDPNDSATRNDKWNGRDDNIERSAFRIHKGWPGDPKGMHGSEGCIVRDNVKDFDAIVSVFSKTVYDDTKTTRITSGTDIFNEYYLGKLTVTE